MYIWLHISESKNERTDGHGYINSAVMQIKNINTSYFLNCKGIYIGFPEHPEKKNETNKEHFS